MLLLWILWIVFNGRLTWEIALIGFAMTGAIYFFCNRFLGYSLKKELLFLKRLPKLIAYYLFLVREIFKANVQVIRILLDFKRDVKPCLVLFKAKPRSPWGKAALADSITLTPGTITVDVDENRYTVHCLDESMAEGLTDSAFEKRILDIEEARRHD